MGTRDDKPLDFVVDIYIKGIFTKVSVFNTFGVFGIGLAQDMFFVENQHRSSATMNVLNI